MNDLLYLIYKMFEKYAKNIKNISTREILSYIFVIIFIIVISFSISYYYLVQTIEIILSLLVFYLMLIYLKIGFIVLESFFYTTAEISLLVLLSQSYCNVPNYSPDSDYALQLILRMGYIFIILKFFKSLFCKVCVYLEGDKKIKKQNNKLIIIFVFICAVYFAQQIYLVVNPIINDSCVLKLPRESSYSVQTGRTLSTH